MWNDRVGDVRSSVDTTVTTVYETEVVDVWTELLDGGSTYATTVTVEVRLSMVAEEDIEQLAVCARVDNMFLVIVGAMITSVTVVSLSSKLPDTCPGPIIVNELNRRKRAREITSILLGEDADIEDRFDGIL